MLSTEQKLFIYYTLSVYVKIDEYLAIKILIQLYDFWNWQCDEHLKGLKPTSDIRTLGSTPMYFNYKCDTRIENVLVGTKDFNQF
jgi:hypothetical protein